MVQKSQKWSKTQIKGSCPKCFTSISQVDWRAYVWAWRSGAVGGGEGGYPQISAVFHSGIDHSNVVNLQDFLVGVLNFHWWSANESS